MSIACCLRLPRDPVFRLTTLLALLAALLFIIGLAGAADTPYRMRWGDVAMGGLRTPLYFNVNSRRLWLAENAIVCPPNPGNYSAPAGVCDKFTRVGRAVEALYALAIVATLVCTVAAMCFVVPLAEKNSRLVVGFTMQFWIPLAFSIVGTALFRQVSVDEAREVLRRTTELAGNPVTILGDFPFRVKAGYGCLVAGVAVQCLGMFVALLRMCTYVSDNAKLKDDVARAPYANDRGGSPPRAAESPAVATHRLMVDERLAHRLVNDDWERQQAIWEQRKEAVIRVLRARQRAAEGAAAPKITADRPHTDDVKSPPTVCATPPPRAQPDKKAAVGFSPSQ